MPQELIKGSNQSSSSGGNTHIPFKYSRAYQSNLKKGDPKFVKFEQQRHTMTQEQINNMIPSLFGKDDQTGNINNNKPRQMVDDVNTKNFSEEAPKSNMFPELNNQISNQGNAFDASPMFKGLFSKLMYLSNRLNDVANMYGAGANYNFDKQLLNQDGQPENRYDLTNTFQVSFSKDELNDLINYGEIPEEFFEELAQEVAKYLETEDYNIEIGEEGVGNISFNTEDISKALYIAKLFNQDSVLFWRFCEGGTHIVDLDSAFIANKDFQVGKRLEANEWVHNLDVLKEMNGNV